MNNWLNLEFSDPQLFELEKIKRAIPLMSREGLEEATLDAIKLSYRFQNAFKSITKEDNKNGLL